VLKASGGGMRFVAAEDFRVKARVIGKLSHVAGVVQSFVGEETKGGGGIENELCVLLVAHDDTSRVGTVTG
jgi:hypothetical protein